MVANRNWFSLISPIAGITPTKPGSATLPFFGVRPELYDENGIQQSEKHPQSGD